MKYCFKYICARVQTTHPHNDKGPHPPPTVVSNVTRGEYTYV